MGQIIPPHIGPRRPSDYLVVGVDDVDPLVAGIAHSRLFACVESGRNGGAARGTLARVAVTLYVRSGCAFCAAARAELARRGVAIAEVNVSEHPEAIPELLKLTKGVRRVPVVVEGGRVSVAAEGGSEF